MDMGMNVQYLYVQMQVTGDIAHYRPGCDHPSEVFGHGLCAAGRLPPSRAEPRNNRSTG